MLNTPYIEYLLDCPPLPVINRHHLDYIYNTCFSFSRGPLFVTTVDGRNPANHLGCLKDSK